MQGVKMVPISITKTDMSQFYFTSPCNYNLTTQVVAYTSLLLPRCCTINLPSPPPPHTEMSLHLWLFTTLGIIPLSSGSRNAGTRPFMAEHQHDRLPGATILPTFTAANDPVNRAPVRARRSVNMSPPGRGWLQHPAADTDDP